MAFLSSSEVAALGFKTVGDNVRISGRASFYHTDRIELGNNCRIDDFCVVSGTVVVGDSVHIAAHCLVDGGDEGIVFEEYSVLAYGCYLFAVSDDYSGESLTSLAVPKEYKLKLIRGKISIGRFAIAGTGTIIFPGASLGEGTAVGAASVVTKPTLPWSMYLGRPAKKIRDRSRKMLADAERLKRSNARSANG